MANSYTTTSFTTTSWTAELVSIGPPLLITVLGAVESLITLNAIEPLITLGVQEEV